MGWKGWMVAVALAAVAWTAWNDRVEFIGDRLRPGNEVVMYSLTTCPYCKRMRARFEQAGVPFTEKFVDTDGRAADELNGLLARHSVPPGAIGTPTLRVNERLLINNPPYEQVVAALRLR